MRELRSVVLAFAFVATVTSSRAADFKTGDMIDKENWQKADGLLPPEILKHYKNGEYANKFVDWPAAKYGQAAGLQGRQRSERRQVHDQPRRHDHRQSDGQATALHHRLSRSRPSTPRSAGRRYKILGTISTAPGTSATSTPSRRSIGSAPPASSGAPTRRELRLL